MGDKFCKRGKFDNNFCYCLECYDGYYWDKDDRECKEERRDHCKPIYKCQYYFYHNFFFKCKKCDDGWYPARDNTECTRCKIDHCSKEYSDGKYEGYSSKGCYCKECDSGYFRTN